MTKFRRVAFIGNHPPRMCGIATFTDSLHRAVSKDEPNLEAFVVAMTETGAEYEYPREVLFDIREDMIGDYAQAAEFLNSADVDVVSLQHEYGIFGGDAGNNILKLLSRLEIPIVTTLHTVLTEPTPMQRTVMDQLVRRSAKIVVMAEKGRELLQSVHDVPAQMIEVIPHGIPDFPFLDSTCGKDKLGLEGKPSSLPSASCHRTRVSRRRSMPCPVLSKPARTRSMSCLVPLIQISCAIKAKPIAIAWLRARANLVLRTRLSFSTSSWRRMTCLNSLR